MKKRMKRILSLILTFVILVSISHIDNMFIEASEPLPTQLDAPEDILQLLGVVKNYAYEVCNASTSVYCSE